MDYPEIDRYALIAAIGLLAWVPLPASAAESGVGGVVTISPARPGPQRIGERSSKPFSGAEVQLRDAAGATVAHAKADASGAFHILVPPGQYQLFIDSRSAVFPRCEQRSVQVVAGQTTPVELNCDSGMR